MSIPAKTTVLAEAVRRLEALGSELDRLGWRTRLTAEGGRVPTLRVQNSEAGASALAEEIYCAPMGDGWVYMWSWWESIASDVPAAAALIGRVLRSADAALPPGGSE